LLYTVGAYQLRIAVTTTNWPHSINIVDRDTGGITLIFPHNRSFVRLKPDGESATPRRPALPAMPAGIDPQPGSVPADAAEMPAMPPMGPDEKLELNDTKDTTNILGFACVRYELKQRGETLEVWATEKLFPFQPYRRNQPHRFGPRLIDEQWPAQLTAKKLFPLRASLRFENCPERYRFEVKSVKEEKITDPGGKLFQPPKDYHELEPLPF
jgi:hypothetical protein